MTHWLTKLQSLIVVAQAVRFVRLAQEGLRVLRRVAGRNRISG